MLLDQLFAIAANGKWQDQIVESQPRFNFENCATTPFRLGWLRYQGRRCGWNGTESTFQSISQDMVTLGSFRGPQGFDGRFQLFLCAGDSSADQGNEKIISSHNFCAVLLRVEVTDIGHRKDNRQIADRLAPEGERRGC